MTSYIELHARSAFSFLEGASVPEDLIGACDLHGMPSIALLDTDNLSGAPRFYMAAKKAKLKAHAGAEITATGNRRHVLLVENRTGYQNLCRLITSMKLRGPKGKAAATEAEFRQYSEGLIALTRNPANIPNLISIYGKNNVYAELQRHYNREEEAINQALMEQDQIPVIATNGVSYATPDSRELQDVLTCVRHKTPITEAGRLLERNAERYLKSPRQMTRLFRDVPHALANTLDLAARLDYTLADLGYQFPPYPVADGETMNSFLRQRTDEGARIRYQPYHDEARNQIEKELRLIEKMNLAGYFLIVWDIVRFCKEKGILAQGRGSAANSAVCYSLGITAVDPVEMKLLFERFLSEQRGEMPDIDIDLPSGDKRESVIQYVYQRYGKHGAAMTANIISYRGRSAARDVGKVLGFTPDELGKLASVVSQWGFKDERETVERQFRNAELDPSHKRIAKFMELYAAIQDLPRHLGQHSGGMVISQFALDSVVPLEPATMPNRVVIQWDKEDCADLGLIKVDLLGLGMMAAIEEAIEIIGNVYEEKVDLAEIDYEDTKVYDQISAADTLGLFQVESRAQMASLPLTKPQKFYDLVIQVAIIRPGPIVGNMYHPFVRRRQGMEEPVSLHSSLDEVLHRTLGVPLFQEQLLKMAMIVANFTGGEAEELRRAMGFKRSEKRMIDIEKRLRDGMDANNIIGEQQDTIVKAITSFALYGFPESHAASFALLAYASAWLRCNYLAAFTAALLNNQPMGFYHPASIVKDSQRHGLRVLPVDVTKSDSVCSVVCGPLPDGRGSVLPASGSGPHNPQSDKYLRLGLNYVKGLRSSVGEAIAAERKRAPFTSIQDLTRRVPEMSKNDVRQLAEIGALNWIGRDDQSNRREALWQTELALKPAGPLLEQLHPQQERSPLEIMTQPERVVADFRGTGMTVGIHPMGMRREELNNRGVLSAAAVKHARHGSIVRIAGSVICRQRPGTAKGFAFFSLEDETGISNAIVAPAMFDDNRLVLTSEPYLLMEGTLQNESGATSVKVARVFPLKFGEELQPSHNFH